MRILSKRSPTGGFAALEVVLVLLVLVAIVGAGAYVAMHNTLGMMPAGGTTTSSTTPTQATATASPSVIVDQSAQQDAQAEAKVDSAADASVQQNATSSNMAVSNVGGAYNENNL